VTNIKYATPAPPPSATPADLPTKIRSRSAAAVLGVSIVAASVGLGGLFFRTQADLLVREDQLDALTPVARDVIETRQSYLQDATNLAPWVLGALIALGIGLATYGLIGWSARQAVIDERENLERDKLRIDVVNLTPAEAMGKISKEAAEAVVPLVPPHVGHGPASVPEGTAGRESVLSTARAAVVRAESAIIDKLALIFGDRLAPNVRLKSTRTTDSPHQKISSVSEYDAIVRPADGSPGYVFEIKYLRDIRNANNRAFDAVYRAAEGAALLAESSNARVIPVAILCLDLQDDDLEAVSSMLARREDEMSRILLEKPVVIGVPMKSLETLTADELQQQIGASPKASASRRWRF